MAFSLLSDKWVLLGIKDEKDTPCLAVWDFRQGNKDLQELDVSKTLVILKYPTYAGSPRFYSMDIRTNPSPLRKDKPSNSQCPFYHDPDNFVLVVTVTSFLHCIPAAHLLSLVASAQSEKTATYEWGSWINRQTCLFIPLNPPSDEWVCYVYGTKFVFADWARHRDESSCLLRLFDFNPLARRDGDQTNNLPPPGLISKQEIVKRLLSGASLPYRSYALYLEDTHDHCQAMISEDNIILVDVSFVFCLLTPCLMEAFCSHLAESSEYLYFNNLDFFRDKIRVPRGLALLRRPARKFHKPQCPKALSGNENAGAFSF